MSTNQRAIIETECCMFFCEQEMGICPIHFEATIAYLPSLVVDAEGKIARFVAITSRVCHHLVVLMYWTLGQRLLLLSQER